jgi:large repetitive protein
MYKTKMSMILASTLIVLSSAISAEAVTITTTSLPNAIVGSAYSNALAATGGLTPYTWKAITAMPAGMKLSTGGVVKGTPTTTGTYSFTFMVSDAKGVTANGTLGLTVVKTTVATTSWDTITNSNQATTSALSDTTTPLTITTSSLTNGTVGIAYADSLLAKGGVTPYTWTVTGGALPPGMVLGTGGKVKGIPTASGSYSFTARVLDSAKGTASYTYSLTIVTP